MIEKVKALPKKVKIMLTTAMLLCMTSAVALAEGGEPATSMTTTHLQSIMSAVTGVISIPTIIGFMVAIVTVSAGFVLMWFGVRRALRSIMASVRRGKLTV